MSIRSKHLRYHGIAVFLLFLALVLSAGLMEVHAQTGLAKNATGRINAATGINLRSSASTSSKVLMRVPDNAKVVILEEVFTSTTSAASNNRWYRVQVSGKTGYVMVKRVDNVKYNVVKGKMTARQYLRAGAGTSMTKNGTIAKDKTAVIVLQVRAKSSSLVWYKIQVGTKYYYLPSTYVSDGKKPPKSTETYAFANASAGALMRAEASPTSKLIMRVPDNKKVYLYEEIFTSKTSNGAKTIWYHAYYDGQEGYLRADQVDGIHYTVKSSAASDEVNTRTGPESGFAQTGQYPKGAPVKVVMKSKYKDNQHYWYKVYEGGKYYYAFASYVKVGGSSKSGIKFLTKAELDSLAAAKKAAEAKKYALPKVNSTQQKRAQAFLNECDKLGKLIVKNKFIYSNSGVQRNYAAAVKCTVKKTNCALYVSWAMQNYGLLPTDKTIWLNNRINGNGTDYIKASKKVAICYPNRKTKDLDLLPGDICGFQVTPLSKHTMVYAGKDAKGRRLWYSAGPTTVPTNLCKVLGTVYDDKEVKVLIRIL